MIIPGWFPPGWQNPAITPFKVSNADAEFIMSFADTNGNGASKQELNDTVMLLNNYEMFFRVTPEVSNLLKVIKNVLKGTSEAFSSVDLNGDGVISYKTTKDSYTWWGGYRQDIPSEVKRVGQRAGSVNHYEDVDLSKSVNLPDFSINKDDLFELTAALRKEFPSQLSHYVITKENVKKFIDKARTAVTYPESDKSAAAETWRKDQAALKAGRTLYNVFDSIADKSIAEATLYYVMDKNDPKTLTDEDFVSSIIKR